MQRRSFRSRIASALCAATLSLCLSLAAPARAAEGEALDLEGTWFVIVHYRDSLTANPEADRWEDKVWKIEKTGTRLKWVEFPIVAFEDESGRFGRVGRNPRARMLQKWEPNASQLEELAAGPRVNSRGSKTKTLRGSPARGYQSGAGSRSASALTVGYQETWSIDDPTGKPVFTRDDALGTEAELATGGDVVSGRTRYATREVLDGGKVLTGTYSRDENKRGSFRMMRTPPPRGLEDAGLSEEEQEERQRQRQREAGREMQRSLTRDVAYREFLEALGDDRVRALRAQLGEDGLNEIWQKYEKRVIGGEERARNELAQELQETWVSSLLEQAVVAVRDWEGDAVARARSQGAPARQIALLESLQETLGADRIAALRAKYGAGLEAGEGNAERAVRDAVRDAYTRQFEAEWRASFEGGEAEAVRQFREQQQKERDRR